MMNNNFKTAENYITLATWKWSEK